MHHKVHNALWEMQHTGNEKQAAWGCVYRSQQWQPQLSLTSVQTVSFTNVFLVCKSFYADFCVQNTAQKNGPLAKEDRRCWLPSNELAANLRFLFLTMYGVSIFLAH